MSIGSNFRITHNGHIIVNEFYEFLNDPIGDDLVEYVTSIYGDILDRETLETYDPTSWYEAEEHLKEFSTRYPDILFSMDKDTPEERKYYRFYIKNGKVQTVKGLITYKAFSESELK